VSTTMMPERLIELIDWDMVHEDDGGSLDDDSDEEDRCAIWEAWQAVVKRRENTEELDDAIRLELLMRAVPSEDWHDGSEPESWVEINDAIARVSPEQRARIASNAKEIVEEVLVMAEQLKEQAK